MIHRTKALLQDVQGLLKREALEGIGNSLSLLSQRLARPRTETIAKPGPDARLDGQRNETTSVLVLAGTAEEHLLK